MTVVNQSSYHGSKSQCHLSGSTVSLSGCSVRHIGSSSHMAGSFSTTTPYESFEPTTARSTDRTPEQEDPGFIQLNTTNVTEVLLRFPGYFRTISEQRALVQANPNPPQPVRNVSRSYTRCFTNGFCELNPLPNPTTTTTLFPTTPTPTTSFTTPFFNTTTFLLGERKRRQISTSPECELDVFNRKDLLFHGCCVSHSQLDQPSTLATAEPGKSGNVQIAQLGNLKQFFEIQRCCQARNCKGYPCSQTYYVVTAVARNCNGCQCSQTYYVVTAVVMKVTASGTLFGVQAVRVPGCCKCLNLSLPPTKEPDDARQNN
ncbi:hypothetical protein ACOMHN_049525 [Nucella lapillus]